MRNSSNQRSFRSQIEIKTSIDDALKRYLDAYVDEINKKVFTHVSAHEWLGEFSQRDIERYTRHNIRAIINAVNFDDIRFLLESVEFVYRVYSSRGVNLDLLLIVFDEAKACAHKFFTKAEVSDIYSIFNFFILEHSSLKEKAQKQKAALNEDNPHYKTQKALYDFVLNSKVEEAEKLSADFIQKYGLNDFFHKVMRIVMIQVGYDWENNHISYAKEHMVSSIFEKMLDAFLWDQVSKHKGFIMVTTPPNEHHMIGANTFVKYLKNQGYEARLIKKESVEELVDEVVKLKPIVLAISVTLPNNLYEVNEIINQTKSKCKEAKVRFAVGGQALEYYHEPLVSIGADAYLKSPQEAIECFQEWFE